MCVCFIPPSLLLAAAGTEGRLGGDHRWALGTSKRQRGRLKGGVRKWVSRGREREGFARKKSSFGEEILAKKLTLKSRKKVDPGRE